ncbi:MAG: hypothetical protein B5M48_03695 [Candidatus Omnitrophica bacterium 4484_213]|nr:MAG: hypothetical protein B5M48_03695 [Candidatus Omnitrophica bacterium 4484_213]
MDQIIIQGGYPLRGEVHISGAKNSALPILAAALLAESKSILKNIPRVKDVDTMLKIISSLGAEITQRTDSIELNPTVKKSFASYEFVSTMRASICLLGPLLAKNIKGAGGRKIEIEGVKNLEGKKHTIIPDRIEAATYTIAGAISRGEVEIKEANPKHLSFLLKKLKQAGVQIVLRPRGLIVQAKERFRPLHLTTAPYPGFPTDVQPLISVLLSLAEGKSVVKEGVYPNRFVYTGELQRMGANIIPREAEIIVQGVNLLKGAKVMASDIRAGAALILAGLAAEGETTVSRVYHIDRGYEDLIKKLSGLGAKIKRRKGRSS